MRRFVGLLSLVFLTGCAGAPAATPSPDPTPTISAAGIVRVGLDVIAMGQHDLNHVGDQCIVKSGYEDLAAGAPVVVTDGAGATVGMGTLGEPTLAVKAGGTTLFQGWCELPFEVLGVPAGKSFYRVKVANRDPLDIAEDSLSDMSLSVGDIPD